jgi:acetyl/propionyl-CoA carboxylase alpha subunit
MGSVGVVRIADGEYLVDVDGRRERVYIAGPLHDRWVFWNGHVYRGNFAAGSTGRRRQRHTASQVAAAPMPATVINVLVKEGQPVRKGDTVVVLEAMKMELPIRAAGDAVVTAVRCRAGDLVQADATLVEFE